MTKKIIYGKEYGEAFEATEEFTDEQILDICRGLACAHYPEGTPLEVGEDTGEYKDSDGHRIYKFYWKHPDLPSHFHMMGNRFRFIGVAHV